MFPWIDSLGPSPGECSGRMVLFTPQCREAGNRGYVFFPEMRVAIQIHSYNSNTVPFNPGYFNLDSPEELNLNNQNGKAFAHL